MNAKKVPQLFVSTDSRRRGDDGARADRIAARREAAALQSRRPATERHIADANIREMRAREASAQAELVDAREYGDVQREAKAQSAIAQFAQAKEQARERLNYWSAQPEPQIADPMERCGPIPSRRCTWGNVGMRSGIEQLPFEGWWQGDWEA